MTYQREGLLFITGIAAIVIMSFGMVGISLVLAHPPTPCGIGAKR